MHECSGVVGEVLQVTRNISAGLCSVHKHFLMVDTIDVLCPWRRLVLRGEEVCVCMYMF